ncbi:MULTISPECIES: sugar ABC transporter ATP-binding protein [Burkholderiaceae]|jgi:ribose transport system ATP-binding protein|uniref:Ribose ABC transport system, ATP-binding protein RbsA n=1 Tax=Caballeronia sordidicola TaxID=196367 RepID=A0A242MN21_CABSO|nr:MULTISPECIES: sugar ABC transporter ATP-binding protein [Burkholderiaceae]AME25995.1 D-ribose transporter ATP-binding protein [Burkholderia sp. PAMC 26561]OTP72601.1 Ribose ABC transport system, ATP-binding protein RbsA [Caballeronia sordidicola]
MATPFLEMRAISKTFPGVKALDGVNLQIRQGEVLALAGENGAGKSTLMKILTGVYAPDPGGKILIEGNEIEMRDGNHARALGIGIIYQELSVVENLSVAENLFLAREPLNRVGLLDRPRMEREARAMLETIELDVDPSTRVSELSVGQQQMVEIAKALAYQSKVIIMDEPTASLSHHETRTLLQLIKRLRERDIAVVYISHRLEEIFELADHVTVLRDGRTVDTSPIAEVTRDSLVRMMVDRELSDLYPGSASSHATGVPVLEVRDLSLRATKGAEARIRDINFTLHRGEILGVAGLVGSGRTEIMEMIFGIRPCTGSIAVDGKSVSIRNPHDAIEHGIGFVTEDRKAQGLVLGMSVRENFSLTHLKRYSPFQFLQRAKEDESCKQFVRSLGIKTPSTEQKVVNLSGGNQQKIVIAKWVARNPKVLIVDEPTRGIDIGAKAEVHALLARLASQGIGIIVISSDLLEVLAVSDRILIVREGRLNGEMTRAEATQERVMAAATA